MRTSHLSSYNHLTKDLWIEDGFHDHEMKKLFATLDEIKSWHVERFNQSIFIQLGLGRSSPDVLLQESYVLRPVKIWGWLHRCERRKKGVISLDFMESPFELDQPQRQAVDPGHPKNGACIADDERPGVSLDMVQVSRHHAHQKDQPGWPRN